MNCLWNAVAARQSKIQNAAFLERRKKTSGVYELLISLWESIDKGHVKHYVLALHVLDSQIRMAHGSTPDRAANAISLARCPSRHEL